CSVGRSRCCRRRGLGWCSLCSSFRSSWCRRLRRGFSIGGRRAWLGYRSGRAVTCRRLRAPIGCFSSPEIVICPYFGSVGVFKPALCLFVFVLCASRSREFLSYLIALAFETVGKKISRFYRRRRFCQLSMCFFKHHRQLSVNAVFVQFPVVCGSQPRFRCRAQGICLLHDQRQF